MIGVARPALEWRPGRIITGDSSGPIAPPSDTPRLVPKGRRNDQLKIVLALVSDKDGASNQARLEFDSLAGSM